MITIDELKQFGANTDEGVARCMGNEEFYLNLPLLLSFVTQF